MNDTPTEDDAVAQFAKQIRDRFPGGKYIHEHIEDGPWRFVTVTGVDKPNWLAEMAMAAYPGRDTVVMYDYAGPSLEGATVHLMPAFAAHIMEWYEDEYDLNLDHDVESETWLTRPAGDLPWCGALLASVRHPDPDAACDRIPDTEGVFDLLREHISSLARSLQDTDQDANALYKSIDAFIDAFQAAATNAP